MIDKEMWKKIELYRSEDWNARKSELTQQPLNIRESEVVAQDFKTKETIAVDTVLNKNENQINKWEIAKKSKELRDKKKRIQELY